MGPPSARILAVGCTTVRAPVSGIHVTTTAFLLHAFYAQRTDGYLPWKLGLWTYHGAGSDGKVSAENEPKWTLPINMKEKLQRWEKKA